MAGSSSIVDLTGTLVNTASASISIDANSLLIVPPGLAPSTFKSISSLALVHTLDTTLNVLPARVLAGGERSWIP